MARETTVQGGFDPRFFLYFRLRSENASGDRGGISDFSNGRSRGCIGQALLRCLGLCLEGRGEIPDRKNPSGERDQRDRDRYENQHVHQRKVARQLPPEG